ncbi:hypothetical protein MKW92_034006 [Papaver armeniacum]|nr:hypothetical protein MKW92_034006 [Papaver armeniacum]
MGGQFTCRRGPPGLPEPALVAFYFGAIFGFEKYDSVRSIYLLKRSLLSFQSLHCGSYLLEMRSKKRTGYLWLRFTVMRGYLHSIFILVPELDLIESIGMHFVLFFPYRCATLQVSFPFELAIIVQSSMVS